MLTGWNVGSPWGRETGSSTKGDKHPEKHGTTLMVSYSVFTSLQRRQTNKISVQDSPHIFDTARWCQLTATTCRWRSAKLCICSGVCPDINSPSLWSSAAGMMQSFEILSKIYQSTPASMSARKGLYAIWHVINSSCNCIFKQRQHWQHLSVPGHLHCYWRVLLLLCF